MNKPYYSDYVKHSLRFYTRNLSLSKFKSEADKKNWFACHNAIKDYPDRDKNILISVYSGYDTLPDEVYNASIKYHIDQNKIWDMMKDFERKVAKRRGLM
jgi:hypothetical protein